MNNRRFPKYRLLAASIVLFAFLLRMYRFAELPPGLFFDEAYNAIDGLAVLHDDYYPIFFTANNGREPFFIYLQSLFLLAGGTTPFVLRLPSVILGTITVALSYPLALRLLSDLAESRRQMIALLTAFLLATMQYHLNFSRIGFRAIAQPMFEALAVYCFYRGAQAAANRGRAWPSFAVSGLALGLAAYTYLSSRLLPIAAVFLVVLAIVWGQRLTRRYLAGLASLVMVAGATAAPLGVYYLWHPEVFIGHSQDVSLLNFGGLATLLENALRVAGMFNWAGDVNWRHNFAGRPVFDPLIGLFFLAGTAILARRLRRLWRQPATSPNGYLALLAVIPAMLLPTLLSEGAPHFLRAIGVLPFLAIIPALAIEALWHRLHQTPANVAAVDAGRPSSAPSFLARPPKPMGSGRRLLSAAILPLVLALVLAFSTAATIKSYFVDWAGADYPYYYFDTPYIDFSRYVQGQETQTRVYLSPWLADHATDRLFLRDRPYAVFDSERTIVLTSKDALYAFQEGGVDIEAAAAFPNKMPAMLRADHVPDRNGKAAFGFYHLAASSSSAVNDVATRLPAPFGPLQQPAGQSLTFGDDLKVLGFRAATDEGATGRLEVSAGVTVPVIIGWQPLRPISDDYTVSLRLLDDNGRRWVQSDSLLGGRTHSTGQWHTDETVVDSAAMVVPADLPPGNYRLAVSLYSLSSKHTLELKVDGQPKGQLAHLTALKVSRPGKDALAALHPPRPVVAPVTSQIWLLGYGLSRDALRAGEGLDLDLFWRADQDVRRDLVMDVVVRDSQGLSVGERRGSPLNEVYPASQWQAGDGVRGSFPIVLSPKAATGGSKIELAIVDRATGATLGKVDLPGPELSEREHQFNAPLPRLGHAARFGDQIELLGFDSESGLPGAGLPHLTVAPGNSLAVSLVWRGIAEMPASYTVFVQLLDAQGNLVAQHDAPPQDGAALTSTWLPQEMIADPHTIALKPDLPSGEYTLIAGLYNALDGKRLPVGQDDFATLAKVQVGQW